jgi:ABC-2 type transport system permease protein
MSSVLLICQKELKSYFASPIAYLLMAFFGLIFGFGMYTATRDVLRFSFQMQMQGQSAPMNLNQQVITPLLGFGSTISLFLIPMITMRLFAEEKRSGTIELLLTSPVTDLQIILGKWLGAMLLYLCILVMSMLNVALLFAWGQTRYPTGSGGVPGPGAAGRMPAGDRGVHLHHHAQPDHRGGRHFFCMPHAVAVELVHLV